MSLTDHKTPFARTMIPSLAQRSGVANSQRSACIDSHTTQDYASQRKVPSSSAHLGNANQGANHERRNQKAAEKIEQPAEPTLLSEAALEQVAGGTKTQADAGPTESVSFAYSKIKVNYEEQ